MMTCKQVSTLMSTGALEAAPLRQRLAVRLHLAMCDKCSAFKRWLETMGQAAKVASDRSEAEAPADLEARVIRRLERSGP
jgi:predicted anti-sigma-YlaC factor YlaD